MVAVSCWLWLNRGHGLPEVRGNVRIIPWGLGNGQSQGKGYDGEDAAKTSNETPGFVYDKPHPVLIRRRVALVDAPGTDLTPEEGVCEAKCNDPSD